MIAVEDLSVSFGHGKTRIDAVKHVSFAVPEGESQDALESSLTYGLLWLEKSRLSAKRGALATLRLILPKGKSAFLANRLRALHECLAVEVYELDPQRETLDRVDPCASGNVALRAAIDSQEPVRKAAE